MSRADIRTGAVLVTLSVTSWCAIGQEERIPRAIPVNPVPAEEQATPGKAEPPNPADEFDESEIPKAIPVEPLEPLEEKDEVPPPKGEYVLPFDPYYVPESENEVVKAEKPRVASALETRTDARTLTLKIPAPRGQITDRSGYPLAQTKIGYSLAVKFPLFENSSDRQILSYARSRIADANRALAVRWSLDDEVILEHYKSRRWLELVFSPPLTEWQRETIEPKLSRGLVLFPWYVRHYPAGKAAAHMVGYVGKSPPWSHGQVSGGESLWPKAIGADGIELTFDEYLSGADGEFNYLFDSDGTKLSEEMIQQPVPGHHVVTTLDLGMQELALEVLQRNTEAGALVVVNVHTGEILAMASNPSYNPNDFVPRISTERYAELSNDPSLPLFARAFRGIYPPASTFKLVVALAALESGTIGRYSEFPCQNAMEIDGRWFHNWNKLAEERMNVAMALARSCNTWFYRVGMRTGGEAVSAMGHRLGYGSKTGLPLQAEATGNMPSSDIVRGALANTSIGQGEVSASPLQVAQMMAGIANGRAVPRLRLVKQIQDIRGEVVKAFPYEDRNELNIAPHNLKIVREGLVAVVNKSWGTGKRASNDYVTLAGKTGTGQWKTGAEGKRYVAWFAGFVPSVAPEYAFAVLYEGAPDETVSGGKKAAPIIGEYFNTIYKRKQASGELAAYKADDEVTTDSPDENAEVADETELEETETPAIARAKPVKTKAEGRPVTESPPRRPGLFGRFKRRR